MIRLILVRVALVFCFFSLSFSSICFADEQSNKRESMMGLALEKLSSENSISNDSKNWEISEAFHYERSKYETKNVWGEVKIFEVDTIIKHCFKKGSIALTVPYIYEKANVRVTGSLLRAGRLVRISRENERSNDGFGDFTLDGVYYFLTEEEKKPVDLMLYSYVKFPSVDNDQGFGTSEYDAGPGLGLNKRLFEKWQFSCGVYYTFIGDPPEKDLRNEFKFNGGLSYDLTSKITLSVAYEQSNPLVKEVTADYEDVLVGINYSFNDSMSFFGEKVFELNNDYLKESIAFGIAARF